MSHDQDEPRDDARSLPALTATNELDAHDFDPANYKWVPVLRRPRADGWTPQRQVEFIAALADSGCVEQAARAVCMSVTSCYRLRRARGAENFAAAWDAALGQAARRLVDLAFDRAINGSDEPLFDRDGSRIGRRLRHNDRLLMFLLRAYMPDRFRHAHHNVRVADEAPPPALARVSEALRRLEPVAPDQPHLLMAPDELVTQLDMADMLQGALPHWHRGTPDIVDSEPFPLGETFEQALEQAKQTAAGAARRPPPNDGDDPILATPSPDLPSETRSSPPPRQRRRGD